MGGFGQFQFTWRFEAHSQFCYWPHQSHSVSAPEEEPEDCAGKKPYFKMFKSVPADASKGNSQKETSPRREQW